MPLVMLLNLLESHPSSRVFNHLSPRWNAFTSEDAKTVNRGPSHLKMKTGRSRGDFPARGRRRLPAL
jgi:hypothetical protein